MSNTSTVALPFALCSNGPKTPVNIFLEIRHIAGKFDLCACCGMQKFWHVSAILPTGVSPFPFPFSSLPCVMRGKCPAKPLAYSRAEPFLQHFSHWPASSSVSQPDTAYGHSNLWPALHSKVWLTQTSRKEVPECTRFLFVDVFDVPVIWWYQPVAAVSCEWEIMVTVCSMNFCPKLYLPPPAMTVAEGISAAFFMQKF